MGDKLLYHDNDGKDNEVDILSVMITIDINDDDDDY